MTSNDDSIFWKRKLAAFLHDPPHKPLRIAGHENARQSFCLETGLHEEDLKNLFERSADHQAAAADRMIFPDPWRSGVRTDWEKETDCVFHHPLCGMPLRPETLPATPEQAEEWLHQALQGAGVQDGDRWEKRWWKTWRLWPEAAARHHALLAYLVADTRVPNHTLWHHNGLVSAINSCVKGCSFMIFQIGPVQDFIRQARSTRDLWAGSFLLSYLISRAIFAVARNLGPESIIYPQLRGVPLLDWFGYSQEGQFWQEELRAGFKTNGVRPELITPNLPNRFLALVPKDWRSADDKSIAETAEQAVHDAWREISGKVRDSITNELGDRFPEWDLLWEQQTARFPVADFIIHDWENTNSVLDKAESGVPPLDGGWQAHPLREAMHWAKERIPKEDRDERCYPLNPGFFWPLHYAAAEWKFAAVKTARTFDAWSGLGVEKDHLDGRNEVLGGANHDAFWDAMREVQWGDKCPPNLFKGRQEYGALTTIKRLFPFVWMPKALDSRAPAFESAKEVAEKIANITVAMESDDEKEPKIKYYAVLCMDGDDMGRWLGGVKTPPWKDVLSGAEGDARTPLGYFQRHWGDGWEKVPTPLTPSFHAAFSEALGNFSLYCAGQIVRAFGGQLIYAGGDDVLAMLPVEDAVDCADALQFVFRGVSPQKEGRGSIKTQEILADLFEFPAPGFVLCKKGSGRGEHTRPNWPLMVPGPRTSASVGLAIGHIRSPMQDVIQAAREAEAAAKTVPGKGGLTVRTLKRSGESVQFSAPFSSGVPGLWAELEECRDKLSKRFIHRYLRKIQPLLATVREGRTGWVENWTQGEVNLIPIIEAELQESLRQQSSYKPGDIGGLASRWTKILTSVSPGNFLHFWMARAFLNRLQEPSTTDRPS